MKYLQLRERKTQSKCKPMMHTYVWLADDKSFVVRSFYNKQKESF
jgi:hypothetical protein